MLKKLSVAALVAAMSVASVPAMVVVAHAQDASEPPTAPDPSDASKGAGDAAKSDAPMKASSSKSMKKSKSKHHHMKKHSSM